MRSTRYARNQPNRARSSPTVRSISRTRAILYWRRSAHNRVALHLTRRNKMNRRNIFSLSAIAALGLAMLPGNVVAQTKSLKDQLVGTWTLVSWEQVHKDGTKAQDFG